MCKFIIVFISLLMCSTIVLTNKIECPFKCKCNLYENLKSVTCKNQSLLMVDAGIPSRVELLDLSYNLIYELENNIFASLNLTSLKLLNVSHNKIRQIHMNAFYQINELKTLDLSYNNIRYLLENWFWSLPNLQELYLQGNSLRRLVQGPIMESQNLKILNFHSCNLLDIHEDSFTKLPNLEMLDLSKNNLIQLSFKTIISLGQIKLVKLEDNPWKCDDIKTFINYCKRRNIICKDPCKEVFPISEEKFQRMIVSPTEETIEQNSWISDEDTKDAYIKKIIEVCNCNNTSDKSLFIEIIELSPILTLIIPFVLGLMVGLVLACSLSPSFWDQKVNYKNFLTLREVNTTKRSKRKTISREPLIQQESFEFSNSTPLPTRKN